VCNHRELPACTQEVKGGLFLVDLAGSERLSKVSAPFARTGRNGCPYPLVPCVTAVLVLCYRP
jgi:hypothetical protein